MGRYEKGYTTVMRCELGVS